MILCMIRCNKTNFIILQNGQMLVTLTSCCDIAYMYVRTWTSVAQCGRYRHRWRWCSPDCWRGKRYLAASSLRTCGQFAATVQRHVTLDRAADERQAGRNMKVLQCSRFSCATEQWSHRRLQMMKTDKMFFFSQHVRCVASRNTPTCIRSVHISSRQNLISLSY